MTKLLRDLEKFRRSCSTNSEKHAVSEAIRIVDMWLKSETGFDSEIEELEKQIEELRQTNQDLARAALSPEIDEDQELEQAIETIQVALSCSFRDNLKLEVTYEHVYLHYEGLKFLVEPMEAWQAVQSCVYLSRLEVEND